MTTRNRDTLLPTILGWGVGGIFIIAPFYAPITVVLAGRLQHFDLLRIWKEIALTGIGLIVLYFLISCLDQTVRIVKERLFQLIIAYSLLLVSIAVYDVTSRRIATPAVIYGLMIHLRLVGFFMVVYLAFRTKQLNKRFVWWKFVMIPAVLVIGFGVLQMTILPDDALKHIGYSKQTIVPFQTVDNRPDFARIQSTLRGPNPLGAYLLVIITLVASFLLNERKANRRKWLLAYLLAGAVVLLGTYSRSAVLGTLASITVLFIVQQKYRPKWLNKSFVLGVCVVLAVSMGGILYIFRDSYVVDTVILHSSDKSTSVESSNSQRSKALKGAVNDVLENPLGSGVGSAGPASLRNTKNQGKLAENFFLQIGQEVGWLGMGLFIAICVVIGARLYALRTTTLALALFASFIGLTLVNMLSHAWSDDTLAYIWWGLAGIALAHNAAQPDTIDKKRKHDGQEATQEKSSL